MMEIGKDLWRSSGPSSRAKAVQDYVQMVFEYLQEWQLLPGQPVPVLSHPYSEKVFAVCFLRPFIYKETVYLKINFHLFI